MSSVDEFKGYTFPPTLEVQLSDTREDLWKFKAKSTLSEDDEKEWNKKFRNVVHLEQQWANTDKSTPEKRLRAEIKFFRESDFGTSYYYTGEWLKARGYLIKETRYFRRGMPPQYSEKASGSRR